MTEHNVNHVNRDVYSSLAFRPETWPADVHALPNVGVGEGISLQPIFDAAAPNRNRPRPLPHRETDQNLVPKQTHEMEERS